MVEYDILIKNATIVDGSGKDRYTGDIAIKEEKIASIGNLSGDAKRTIQATSLIATPGFIDPHSHADIGILRLPTADNLVMQGITTFIGGNCGLSMAPIIDTDLFIELFTGGEGRSLGYELDWNSFAQWLSIVENKGIALNYVPLIGHQAIRVAVMGMDFKRPATNEEILKMRGLVEQAMREGAWGMSTFRDPSPTEYAHIDEIVALASVVKKYNGYYIPHTYRIQSQWPTGDKEEYGYIVFHGPIEDVLVGRYRGYIEAIEVGRRTGVPVHIAHLSLAYIIPQPYPNYMDKTLAHGTLEIINKARKEGIDVTFDVIAADSSIAGQLPLIQSFNQWIDPLLKPTKLLEKLKSQSFREEVHRTHEFGRLKFAMIHTKADPYWMDCFKIVKCTNKDYQNKTITEITQQKGLEPLDTLMNILVEDPQTIWVQFKDKRMSDEAIAVFLKHPVGMPCTDTLYVIPLEIREESMLAGYGLAPIMYGLYPHYFGHFVRDRGDISLEKAVRQATYVPANRFGIESRGRLQAEYYADIVLLDINSIRMCGDFSEPARKPDGISYVLVNGQVVYDGNLVTGALPGKVLRHG
jgi:N-acyl-D-aspartate/D-glutamate deacylase